MADPAFPRRWGAPTFKVGTNLLYCQMFPRKLHENERNWIQREGARPWRSLRSASDLIDLKQEILTVFPTLPQISTFEFSPVFKNYHCFHRLWVAHLVTVEILKFEKRLIMVPSEGTPKKSQTSQCSLDLFLLNKNAISIILFCFRFCHTCARLQWDRVPRTTHFSGNNRTLCPSCHRKMQCIQAYCRKAGHIPPMKSVKGTNYYYSFRRGLVSGSNILYNDICLCMQLLPM